MKKSPLPVILLGVLAVSAMASVIFCLLYLLNTRQLQRLQSQAAVIQFRQQAIQALAGDVVEYSKKNPAVNPILESVGVKAVTSGASPAPTNKPATR